MKRNKFNYVVRCKKTVPSTCSKGEFFKGIDEGFSTSLLEVQLFKDETEAHDITLHEYIGNNVNDKFEGIFITDYFDETILNDAFYDYFEILPVEVTLIGEEK